MENTLTPSIYESIEALNAYLQEIRAKREARQQQKSRAFLNEAISLIQEEIRITEGMQDEEIMQELQGVLAEFEKRLAALEAPITLLVGSPPLIIISETTEAHEIEIAPPISEEIDTAHEEQISLFLEKVGAVSVAWNELEQEGGLEIKNPAQKKLHWIRVRSLACTLAEMQVQAKEAKVWEQVSIPLCELRENMILARGYAEDNSAHALFDTSLWDEPSLTAQEWEELSKLYTEMEKAQSAWNWYLHNHMQLTPNPKLNLLNSIGAVQQMLFTCINEFGIKDQTQVDLYVNLTKEATDVGFLSSLNRDLAWESLQSLAKGLEKVWSNAKEDVEQAEVRQADEVQKKEAQQQKGNVIQAVVAWGHEQKVKEHSTEEMRESLFPLLDACLATKVPPSNVQVRGALLDFPNLLVGQPKYGKFLEFVNKQRSHLKLDLPLKENTEEEEDIDLSDIEVQEVLELVKMYVEGQKILILGGARRPQVETNLQQKIDCLEVTWADSRKGDKLNKFKTAIKKADILIALKNFASHEIVLEGRKFAEEQSTQYVVLPAGYGINQIIKQIHDQLVEPSNGKKAASTTKNSKGTTPISDLKILP